MAFVPYHGGFAPTPGISDPIQKLMEGYRQSQAPAAMKRQAEMEELKKQLLGTQAKYAPQKAEQEINMDMLKQMLTKNQIEQQKQELALPADERFLSKLHGYPNEALGLALIKQKFGPDSEVYQMAKRRIETEIAGKEGLTELREVYKETTPKARATPLAKSNMELQEAKQGFVPGTNREEVINNPEQQKKLENQYELDINKKTSDVGTRQKTLVATNIDKTLARINPIDLVQFGGIKGQTELKAEEFAAATGKPSEKYLNYLDARTNAELLTKQIRQFYGDSIQPQVAKAIKMLTNPASFRNDPKSAMKIFEGLKRTLELETETYRDAQASTDVYRGKQKSSNFTDADIMHTAQKYGITPEEVRRRLQGTK